MSLNTNPWLADKQHLVKQEQHPTNGIDKCIVNYISQLKLTTDNCTIVSNYSAKKHILQMQINALK